jgi:hypothetical protein
VQRQRRTNDKSSSRDDNALGEWTAINHVLWSAESGNLPYKYKQTDIVCLQLPYRQNEITTQEITNRKLIQIEAYTVPTRGQRTASRKMTTWKYRWEPTLYQPGARGPHPKWEHTLYQPGARGSHPKKWQNEIWYKWESTLYQLGARGPHPEK